MPVMANGIDNATIDETISRGRILFLGNSVNLVANRNLCFDWKKVLEELEKKYIAQDILEIAPGEALSYNQRLERIANFADLQKEDWRGYWKSMLEQLKPTFVHYLLAPHVANFLFTTVLTTNFDSVFDDAIEEAYQRAKVPKEERLAPIHIHGSAKHDKELVFTRSSYEKALTTLELQDWPELFYSQEVHICGFAFNSDELLLWKVLHERRERLRQNTPHFTPISNRVFAYLFYTQENKKDIIALATLLRCYAVRPILIPVPKGMDDQDDYRAAWLQLIARMQMIIYRHRYSKGESSNICTCRYAQSESKNLPLATAYSPSPLYPFSGWVSIEKKKLENPKFTNWYFYCNLDDFESVWTCSVADIRAGVQDYSVKDTYHFYLDTIQKKLFYAEKGAVGSELQLVCPLVKIDPISRLDQELKSFQ